MHETLCSDVKGHIDETKHKHDTLCVKGWCFHTTQNILPLRAKSIEGVVSVDTVKRPCVAIHYSNTSILNCGWEVVIPNNKYDLEMFIDNKWVRILELNNTIPPDIVVRYTKREFPSFVAVDNFYENPDSIREFALQQMFLEDSTYYKGKRACNNHFRFPGLKEQFEEILCAKIKNWDSGGLNGCFQYCTSDDRSVYHCDNQEYAGVLYLTPDAPPDSGTRFYRSKQTKKMTVPSEEHSTVFKNGYYDSTQFELIDVVGNVYNRLILFHSKFIHAAPVYFGKNKYDSRLFQLFFFDIDKESV